MALLYSEVKKKNLYIHGGKRKKKGLGHIAVSAVFMLFLLGTIYFTYSIESVVVVLLF